MNRKIHFNLFLLATLFSLALPCLATPVSWPQYRQNAQHTGQTNINVFGCPGNPVIGWTNRLLSADRFRNSAAIRDVRSLYICDDNRRVYLLTNGKVQNNISISGSFDTLMSPTLGFGDSVLVGGGMSGSKIWKFTWNLLSSWSSTSLGNSVNSEVTTSQKNMFCAADISGEVTLFSNDAPLWIANTGYPIQKTSPLFLPDGKLVVGASSLVSGGFLTCYSNGNIIWSITNGLLRASPTLAPDGTIYSIHDPGILYAYTNGKLKWQVNVGGIPPFKSAPSVSQSGKITVACSNRIVTVDQNGNILWQNDLGGLITDSVAVGADGLIYTGTMSSNLYALDGNTGKIVWTFRAKDRIYNCTPALNNDGSVIFTDQYGCLYSIKQGPTPAQSWTKVQAISHDSISLSWKINGNISSQTLFASVVSNTNTATRIAVFPSSVSNYVLTGLPDNTTYHFWIKGSLGSITSRYSGKATATTWHTKAVSWRMLGRNPSHNGNPNSSVQGVKRNPYIKWTQVVEGGANGVSKTPSLGFDGTLYVSSEFGQVHAFNPNGSQKWETVIWQPLSPTTVGLDGQIYVGNNLGSFNSLRPNGSVKWSRNWGSGINSGACISTNQTVFLGAGYNLFAITNDGIFWSIPFPDSLQADIALDAKGNVYAVDASGHLKSYTQTGSLRWSFDIPSGPFVIAPITIGQDNTVYVADFNSILYAITNGAVKWSRNFLPATLEKTVAIGPNGTVYVLPNNNRLHALNPNDGSILWTNSLPDYPSAAPCVDGSGTVYCANNNGFVYAVSNGITRWSFSVKSGSAISGTPVIADDGTLYVCTVGSGNSVFAIGQMAQVDWKSIVSTSTNNNILAWKPISLVTAYSLFRGTSGNRNMASLVTVLPSTSSNYVDTGLSELTMYHYWIAPNVSSGVSTVSIAISNTTLPKSPIPVFTSTSLPGERAIHLNWEQKSNVTTWTLFRNNSKTTFLATRVATLASSITNFTDSSGLLPNKWYYYWLKSSNPSGASPFSTLISNCTYAELPKLLAMPPAGTLSVNSNFIFTCTNHAGTISGLRYRLDSSLSGFLAMTDSYWPGNFQQQYPLILEEGLWYLHVSSYNQKGILNPPLHLGPFIHFKQIVKNVGLQIDRPRINPADGSEAIISTSRPLSNVNSPFSNISIPKRFYIEILDGICDIACSGTNNGKPFIMSGPDNFAFTVSGPVISKVRLRVSWEADPGKSAEITFLISPPMDLSVENPVVIYNSILNPELGEKLDIYLEAGETEKVTLKIYDIVGKRLLYESVSEYGSFRNMNWDLTLPDGTLVPDNLYGIFVKSEKWKRELKFVVNRKKKN